MRTEIFDLIVGKAKEIFGLNPESTEAEVHQKMTEASDDLKTDLIVNVANQIANFAADEIQKKIDLFAEQLKQENTEIIEQLNAKLDIMQARMNDLESKINSADIDTKIESFRADFGKELNEIKAAKGINISGDGNVIEKAGEKKATPPSQSTWKIKL